MRLGGVGIYQKEVPGTVRGAEHMLLLFIDYVQLPKIIDLCT